MLGREVTWRDGVTSALMVFIVRISVDEEGAVRGVVEQVRTGRKEPIHAVADVSRVIAVMVAAERLDARM
jgi:hypothetical protein